MTGSDSGVRMRSRSPSAGSRTQSRRNGGRPAMAGQWAGSSSWSPARMSPKVRCKVSGSRTSDGISRRCSTGLRPTGWLCFMRSTSPGTNGPDCLPSSPVVARWTTLVPRVTRLGGRLIGVPMRGITGMVCVRRRSAAYSPICSFDDRVTISSCHGLPIHRPSRPRD